MTASQLLGKTITNVLNGENGTLILELDREVELVVSLDLAPTEGPECPTLTHEIRPVVAGVSF